MDFEDAKSTLAEALRKLDAAGSGGFEGLLRDVMVQVTGLSFGLAKSGPQDGSDVRSLGGANLFEVALEAKRYGAKTTLAVDALEAKLVDSWKSQTPTDLWVLAATREISATDQERLIQTGERLGITVLVLDWPPKLGVLPDLAVLCGEGQAALGRHLSGRSDLGEILDVIRAHPNYVSAAERLHRRLAAPDIGYAAATEAMKKWMLGGLENNRNAASRLGGTFNNLLDSTRGRIPRPKYDARLDQWFASMSPAVLLGDEGLGKTWLFLSWWYSRATAVPGLPLTLFVPAKEVGQESLVDLLAGLLEKRLGSGGIAFWRRRITQWLTLRNGGPQVILMIDGLNQHWQKRDWADLLQPAYDDTFNGRIAVLTSSWPDHWNDLQKLAPLTPPATEIMVQRFDDSELDALLAAHQLSRDTFNPAMLELMRVPRISELAITRHQDLVASGDITPERLAVEDWKHRIDRRGHQLALSDTEFQSFVADLGTHLRSSIEETVLTRHSIYERLGRDSGRNRTDLLSTVAELISGQWLVPTSQPNQFRVNPELVPFALGLALANELAGAADDAAANAIIADFIDPFSGQSIGVRILRGAVTTALLNSAVSRPARRALLVRWITEQNFGRTDFEAFWRLIGLDPELVLQIVEESWLGQGTGSIATDEVIIKGLANAHKFETVAPFIDASVARWLGWFWPDGLDGAVIGRLDLSSEDSRRRQDRTAENLAEWERFEGRSTFPQIERCGPGNPSWLSHRVFGIVSFLPRSSFSDAFAAWGISRAIMGMPRHFDELAWVLRLNHDDATAARKAVGDIVERLIATNERLALDAACWLLEALADQKAEVRLREVRPNSGPASTRSTSPNMADNEDILNPAVSVEPITNGAPVETLSFRLDFNFERDRNLLAFARFEPRKLRNVVHDLALNAGALEAAALIKLMNRLGPVVTILTEEERNAIQTAVEAVLARQGPEQSKERYEWQVRLLELKLASRSGRAQIEYLFDEVHDPKLMGHVQTKLLDFEQADIRAVLGRFDEVTDKDTLLSWLALLVETADHRSIDGWAELPRLLRHADPEIVERAIALADESRDPEVLSIIAEGTWTAAVQDRTQRYNRSMALLRASEVLKRPELLQRADSEIVAVWLQREPENPEALAAYEGLIRTAVDGLSLPTRSVARPLVDHGRAIAELLDRANDEFWCWLERAIGNDVQVSNVDLMDEFPLIKLTHALMSRRPKLGLELWRKLSAAMDDGVVKVAGLTYLPFLASGEPADEARGAVLAAAINDQQLADAVRQAGKIGASVWLADKAKELALVGTTEALALSITTLGFADESQAAEMAWKEIEVLAPRGGWLEGVYGVSRRCYERNRWARHWYRRFLLSTTDDEALAAIILLGATMDTRAVHWIDRREVTSSEPGRRRLWLGYTDTLNAESKRRRDKLKGTLFSTKTMSQTHWPWL